MNKRLEINCTKGFGILVIMCSHVLFANTYNPVSFASLLGFCVPIYFYCTGFEYIKYKGSLAKEYKLKVFRLATYALSIFLILLLIHTAILLLSNQLDFISCLKSICLCFMDENSINFFPEGTILIQDYHDIFCPYWFIVLFVLCLILFIPLTRLIEKNNKIGIIVPIVLLILSAVVYCFAGNLPMASHLTPSFTCIMVVAYLLKKYKINEKLESLKTPWVFVISLAIFILGEIIASQIGLQKIARGRFDENDASFVCWLMGMISMVLCSFGFLNLSRVFTKIKPLTSFLSWAGINSLDIMLVHMFFVVEFSKITSIPNGRMFFEAQDVTPELQLQFLIVLVASLFGSWLYIYLKNFILKKAALRKFKIS